MATSTVTIGCDDTERGRRLTAAVEARSAVSVGCTWPLERAAAAGLDPDTKVVVFDGFPPPAALRTMADVTRTRPDLGALVLGPLDQDVDALIALASGAFGYLPARSTPDDVAAAVDTMLAGEAVLPRAVSYPLLQHFRWSRRGIVVRDVEGRTTELTHREWEVLVLLRQARTTTEIARQLVVSNATVRSHIAALVHKLGATSRASLAVPDGAASG